MITYVILLQNNNHENIFFFHPAYFFNKHTGTGTCKARVFGYTNGKAYRRYKTDHETYYFKWGIDNKGFSKLISRKSKVAGKRCASKPERETSWQHGRSIEINGYV